MRMFDSLSTHIVIGFLSSIVGAVNILLIVAVWRHSPKTMGPFRIYMLKLTITDFAFASSIAWLFLPNLLFPLPGAMVEGLLKFTGEHAGYMAFTTTIITGGATMLSLNFNCLYSVIYLGALEYVGLILVIGIMAYFGLASPEEIAGYAHRHNITSILNNLPKDAHVVLFDLDKPIVLTGMAVIGVFLIISAISNVYANWKVRRKIINTKATMSKQTYEMQKSLTYVLITQAVVPTASISVPVLIYQSALLFFWKDILESSVVEWIVVLVVGGYPLFNSTLSIYFMKPYRNFVARLVKSALFCVRWTENSSIVIDIPSTSSTLERTPNK